MFKPFMEFYAGEDYFTLLHHFIAECSYVVIFH